MDQPQPCFNSSTYRDKKKIIASRNYIILHHNRRILNHSPLFKRINLLDLLCFLREVDATSLSKTATCYLYYLNEKMNRVGEMAPTLLKTESLLRQVVLFRFLSMMRSVEM
jgi:hypothetical protein